MIITNAVAFAFCCVVGTVILLLHLTAALLAPKCAFLEYFTLVLHFPLIILLCLSGIGLDVALCVMLASFLIRLGSVLLFERVKRRRISSKEGEI